jgi:hydroxypyruvate isomerase
MRPRPGHRRELARGGEDGILRLAASAGMLFLDLPFGDRVRRIADLGLEVEIWDRTTKDVDALAATGASFSS